MSQDWFETYSGLKFDIQELNADMIDIKDIAHALSCTGRFNGHGSLFYSVAEHSVQVSYLCPRNPLAGLLHDASEAYLTDVVSPIKPLLKDYKPLEDKVMRVVAIKFGFEYPLTADVKLADVIALSTEAKSMIKSEGNTWEWGVLSPTKQRPTQHAFKVWNWEPKRAEEEFLKRFYFLTEHYEALRAV